MNHFYPTSSAFHSLLLQNLTMSADTNPKPHKSLVRRGVKTFNPPGNVPLPRPALPRPFPATCSPLHPFPRCPALPAHWPPDHSVPAPNNPAPRALALSACAVVHGRWVGSEAEFLAPVRCARRDVRPVRRHHIRLLRRLPFYQHPRLHLHPHLRGFRRRRADHRCRIPLAATPGGQHHVRRGYLWRNHFRDPTAEI